MGHRVIQWATGNIGMRSLSAALAHRDLDVVGVRVYGAGKVGIDAGTLAGGATTGVVATDDVDALIALDADCVLHMPASLDVDELCRLLASGKNVVSTCSQLVHTRRAMPADDVDRLESACRAGGVSLFAVGSSPGFITDYLPLTLLLEERSLRTLGIEEFADLSQRPSPELLFDVMGMGREPGPVDARRAAHLRGAFGPSLEALAERIGLTIDGLDAVVDVAVASRPVTIAAGDIAEGRIAAQRTTIRAMSGGDARLTFRATWYCTTELDQDWDLGATEWRVTVDGDAPLTVDVAFDVPTERLGDMTPGLTAHPAVNAVATVCAARPGVLTSADLPVIVPKFS